MKKYYKKVWPILVLITLLSVVGIYFFIHRSLPKTVGELVVFNKEINSQVEMVSDNWGIPHIYAQNESDANFVLGYKMASDRLFQMELYRRMSQGTLAEIFGKDALELDKMFRTVGFAHYARKLYQKRLAAMNPMMLADLRKFFAGINYYIEHETLPYEFSLLNFRPAKFNPEDSIAFIGYMGFRFAVGIKQDLLFSNLSKILSPALFTQLRNNSGNIPKTQMQIGRVLLDNLQKFEAAHDLALPAFDGSNAWVLSPWRSKSGGALLASDPHIGFSNPNIWYEAHVETPSWKLYGHFLPLIPFPVLGHNLDYGWAITIAYYDDMDLYRETISEDGRSVMFQERWVPLERYPQVIKVKGHSDFKFDLLITPHGPLLSSLFPKENISLKWTYYMEENATLEGLYKMGHAQNMEDFKQGVALGASPGLNILYADKIGNIGWWPMGAIPLRNKSDDGDLILDGASGVDEYIRYLEFREKPSSENPSSGVIISANQRPRNDSWGLRGYWPADNRYLSIDKMLMAQEKWSLEELKKVQTASFDVGIAHHLEILLRAINVEQMLNDTKNGESYRMVTRLLSNWDMRSEVDSAPAAIYHQTMRQALIFLLDELSSGEMMGGGMGPKEYCQLDAKDFFFNALLDDRESAWWDIKATSNIESRDDILRMAFAEALDFLRSRWGADPASWKWGALHTLEFTHPLGRKYPLNYIFNVGPLAVSGGANQINHYHDTGCESEFKVTAGASTRRLIDFYDATNSWGILPLGISGHILSKHYKDQLPLFIGGKYRSQWLERSSIEKNRESVLIFRAL